MVPMTSFKEAICYNGNILRAMPVGYRDCCKKKQKIRFLGKTKTFILFSQKPCSLSAFNSFIAPTLISLKFIFLDYDNCETDKCRQVRDARCHQVNSAIENIVKNYKAHREKKSVESLRD